MESVLSQLLKKRRQLKLSEPRHFQGGSSNDFRLVQFLLSPIISCHTVILYSVAVKGHVGN